MRAFLVLMALSMASFVNSFTITQVITDFSLTAFNFVIRFARPLAFFELNKPIGLGSVLTWSRFMPKIFLITSAIPLEITPVPLLAKCTSLVMLFIFSSFFQVLFSLYYDSFLND